MIQTDSFDEERVLYLEKMDLREKTKINIGNIARKANEEINALKLEKLNLKGNNKKKYTIEDINKKSLEQTKKSLESIIINNLDVFKSYAMLTYTENVDNIDIAFDSFRNYMLEVKRHLKRAGKELCYICVPEIKEGEAINFHVLWNERIGTNTIPIKIKKEVMFEDEIVTIECYDLPLWWHGTSIAFKIETLDDALKITKHLTKAINNVDNDKLYPKQKILKSKKLKISKEST